MRELTTTEIQMVSGAGSLPVDAETTMIATGVAAGANQVLRGARIGAVLGPKGALGGAIIGGLSWGVANAYSYFRGS